MPFSDSVKVSFGNSGPRNTIRKIDDKGLIARLLPPLHSCSVPGPNAGRWAILHKQHFGYDTVSASGDRNWNTFYCVEQFDFKTKTITDPCPECENIKSKKALMEATKKELGFAGKTKEEILRVVEPLDNWLRKHNLDAKWYINVKTVEGDYVTLKIGTKLKKKLDTLIKELREPTRAGQRPIDVFDPVDGIWLEFSRTGKGFDSEYDVRPSMESKTVQVDGQDTVVQIVRRAPLADNEKEAAEATTYDLADVGIRRITKPQVAQLVQVDGNPDAVEAIFKAGQAAEKPAAAPAPTPVVQQAAPQPEPVLPSNEAVEARAKQDIAKAEQLVAQVGNKTAVQPLSTEPGPRPGPKPAAPVMSDFMSMSIEDLQKRFGPQAK